MGQLIVNYSKLNGLSNTARKVADKYEDRINELERFRKKINNVNTSNRGYLDQASYQIKNRIDKCEQKKQSMEMFHLKIEEFEDRAKQVDKQVANKIKQDTKSFKFKNNIKTGAICRLIVHLDESVFRGLDKYKILIELITGGTLDEFKDNLRKGLRNTKYNIKDWYYNEGGRYKLEKIVDTGKIVLGTAAIIAVVVAAILATGGSAAVGGAAVAGGAAAGGAATAGAATAGGISTTVALSSWGILSAASDYEYDSHALDEFNKSGNISKADRLKSKGLFDLAGQAWGNVTDYAFGNRKIGEFTGKCLVFGGEITTFANDLSGIRGIDKWKNDASIYDNLINVSGWNKNNSVYKNIVNTINFSDTDMESINKKVDFVGKLINNTGLFGSERIKKLQSLTNDILVIQEKMKTFKLINSGGSNIFKRSMEVTNVLID